MKGTLVVAGSLAQKPRHGGHAWVLLHYLLGFRRLGWDVLFLDRLAPGEAVDEAGRPCRPEDSVNVRYVHRVMRRLGLGDRFAVDGGRGESAAGIPRREVLARTRRAAFLLNVMGFLTDAEVLAAARRRVFLDIDPGFGQMWRALGLADVFDGHDAFVTIGENVGRPDCTIPTCGLPWVTTRPPVVLAYWPVQPAPRRRRLTSVASWRGAYGPVEYEGCTYGLRVHEFRRFVELPSRCGDVLEVALQIHPEERRDLALLDENGWRLTDPGRVAGDPWRYRRYVQRSTGEFMVAKNMYVRSNSGWVSDRSVCYLASGRPVVAQDTGLAGRYPTGEGLLTFRTPDEAAAAVGAVLGDYARHARAARRLAEDCFDSDVVLPRLLERIGEA